MEQERNLETGNRETVTMENKRTVAKNERGTLDVSDILLVGILLAAGVILKFFVGTVINFGMKPNFIIAMYCLAILLIRPRLLQAAIIGILAGITCQFFPGQPYINIISELLGALVMALMLKLPLPLFIQKFTACFVATLASGFTFIGIMYAMYYMGADITPTPLFVFLAIILGTAILNSLIVQMLYIPLKLALHKE